jgi:hypothetical protein
MIEIDHNPHEQRPTNTIWWVGWTLIALLWVWYLYFFKFDWIPLALGGISGIALTCWAVTMTDNKVPSWMGGGPPRR